jgi:hypothetical protein
MEGVCASQRSGIIGTPQCPIFSFSPEDKVIGTLRECSDIYRGNGAVLLAKNYFRVRSQRDHRSMSFLFEKLGHPKIMQEGALDFYEMEWYTSCFNGQENASP